MDQPYDELFKPGDKLIIELAATHEVYEGIFSDGGKNRIDIKNVKLHNNCNNLEGIYTFYRNEILSIRLMHAKKTVREPKDDIENITHKISSIRISEDEYFRLKEVSKNYIYLENADSRYFKAVKELNDAETIGVVCLGAKERNAVIRLLVMCTWKQVYIFDFADIQKRQFYPELKEIFECTYICKVMHKSATYVDTLYRCYGVYCQNTFDTMLVDLMVQKKENGKCPELERSLSECLNHYLNFPLSLLENAMSVPEKKWIERPLSDKRKLYAAQLATYLLLLKDHMEKALFKNMYDMINKVQDMVYDKTDFEFKMYANRNEVDPDVKLLIPDYSTGVHSSDKNGVADDNKKVKDNAFVLERKTDKSRKHKIIRKSC